MWVRFLVDWAGPQQAFHPAGAELEVDQATAQLLLHGAIAEPVAPPPLESATMGPPAVAARVGRSKSRKARR